MNNHTSKSAALKSLWAVIAVMLLMLLALTGNVSAETEEATDSTGFSKKDTGVTDDSTYYVSASLGISMIGGKGTFELDEYTTIDFDMQVRSNTYGTANDDKLVISFVDSADSGNSVTISIWAYDTANTYVEVEDNYNGESNSDSTTKAVDIYQTFAGVDIDLTKTSSGTDGTKQQISVSVGGVDFVDNMALYSSEVSTERQARSWDECEVGNPGGELVTGDDIKIDTHTQSPWALNWTWFAILILALGAGIAWWFKVWPLNGKGNFLTGITRGKLGH